MKKFMIIACAAVMSLTSCTSESFFDVEEVQSEEANKSFFDESESDLVTFCEACESIIVTHKDFDYFRELLTETQLEKIDEKKFSIDDAVEIIFRWYDNDETFDIMCEWPAWDDFKEYFPKKYCDKYAFRFCH